MSNKGIRSSFPRHRNTVLEILQAAKTVPAFPLQKSIDVSEVEYQRRHAAVRIGWTAIFIKAYGLVCQAQPDLRTIFISHPTASLYQHPHAVCSVSVHRNDSHGNERLIWGRLVDPAAMSLSQIQQQLGDFVEKPLEEVYREGLILEKSPWVLRQLSWWWTMRWSGRKRAKHIGTFSVSSLGGQGCLNGNHPLITTSSLAFSPIDENGFMEVVLLCDHRTLDGMHGAKALNALEHMLQKKIASELASLGRNNQAAA